jgi:hypothetical protein
MKWKFAGSLLIIAFLLFFLYSQQFFKQLPKFDFSQYVNIETFGKFYENLKTLVLKRRLEKFRIEAEFNSNSLRGNKLNLFNTTLIVNGVCEEFSVNEIKIGKGGENCSFGARIKNGKLFFSEELEVNGVSDEFVLNENIYTAKNMKIVFKIEPQNVFIGTFSQNKLSLSLVYGEIKKLKLDGSLDYLKVLEGDNCSIHNFDGVLNLNGDKASLAGSATKVSWGDGF